VYFPNGLKPGAPQNALDRDNRGDNLEQWEPNLPGARRKDKKCRFFCYYGSSVNWNGWEGHKMALGNGEEQIAEDRRKEIFLALVDAQDHELDVSQSRKLIATRFGISEGQIRRIEREGLDRQWPPL
jgi:hypothetical protein